MESGKDGFTAQLKRYFASGLGKSRTELARSARLHAAGAVRALEQAGMEGRAARTLVLMFIASALSRDGEISRNEQQLIAEVFGKSVASKINAMAGELGEAQYAQMDRVADALPFEDKMCLCELALDFSAADGAITDKEIAYLVKLFE